MRLNLRRTRPASGLALAVCAALQPLSCLAANGAAPGPHDLDTVVVTDLAPSSALTWRTDPRLPRQPVPASDGADYLKTVPGFSALRNGGTNSDPVLRGMSGSRLNLLSNDGAMPGACPSRMDNPLSYVAPETYDRLVVTKGPQTVRWGPGGSAGTVRFERQAPVFHAPGLRLRGSLLTAAHGRQDQVLDATAGQALGYARLSANRSRADDYRDGDGTRVPSAWDKWNADLALGWTPSADTRVELGLGAGDGQARYAGRGMDGTMFRRDSRSLVVERQNLPGVWEAVRASVHDNRADHLMDNYGLRQPNPHGAMPMAMASNVLRHTRGGRIELEARGQDWGLVLGVDGHDSRHRGRNASGVDAWRGLPWRDDARLAQLGVFAEGHWTVAAGSQWVAGLRLDRAGAQDLREQTGSGMMARPNPTAGQVRGHRLPAGFLRYEKDLASRPVSLYAGLGHTRRMPDYWELYSPQAGPAGAPNAFAGMRPNAPPSWTWAWSTVARACRPGCRPMRDRCRTTSSSPTTPAG
jgi:iron complex outermembrane receptor protein